MGRFFLAVWMIGAVGAAGAEPSFYQSRIQPIFDAKCVACHACTQSPCQVNLASYEGVTRGAKNVDAYARRLSRIAPLRMFIDGNSTEDWRARGFWPVLGRTAWSSILWQMLDLKREIPNEPISLPAEQALQASDMCPKLASPDAAGIRGFRAFFRSKHLFSRSKRSFGMPYGLPGLDPSELDALTRWMDAGSPGPSAPETEAAARPRDGQVEAQIRQWETFLNGSSLKSQLVARYLYEHLFLARLYFATETGAFQPGSEREFYRLVRTTDLNGPVSGESPARHPYDEPALGGRWAYRLRKIHDTIVVKNHIPYPLYPSRLARIEELFFQNDWQPTKLPPYGPVASNPFTTFAEIPAWARYQFLLDDAEYFTRTDIRGPVCNGTLAVNVIQDLGWRIYLKPTSDPSVIDPGFFQRRDRRGESIAQMLGMPAETQASTEQAALEVLKRSFLRREKQYAALKDGAWAQIRPRLGMQDLYLGDANGGHGWKQGKSRFAGAAQTIFRHGNSASVESGLAGHFPKTVELFDFPIMERTYYDLVAGFDVYASTIDGLNTRAYKDSLRVEAEDNFLKLLPWRSRAGVRHSWYYAKTAVQQAALQAWMGLWNPLYPAPSPERDTTDSYPGAAFEKAGGETIARFVMRRLVAHYRRADVGAQDYLSCPECGAYLREASLPADVLAAARGLRAETGAARYFPEVIFLKVGDRPLTLLTHRFRSHLKFFFDESRVPKRDAFQVFDGLTGDFPNLFVDVSPSQLPTLLREMETVSSERAYRAWRARWAIRRNDPRIWSLADWFYRYQLARHPVDAGRFDLLRYEIFY